MKIVLNGKEREFPRDMTIARLVDEITRDRTRVAVERNRLIVPRVEWEYALVADGDEVEVVTLVGGG